MRKLLVPVSGQYDPEHPESLDEAALAAGFTMARHLDAHMEVFCIEAQRQGAPKQLASWVPGSAVNDVLSSIEAEHEKRRRRARATFTEVATRFGGPPLEQPGTGTGFSVDFVQRAGDVGDAVAARGRVADLVVAANHGGGGKPSTILLTALRQTGRPVLVAPREPVRTIGERILVAWNGRLEASRAVAMSMDLLLKAAEVTVVSVSEDGMADPSAEDLTDYLKLHGIGARRVALDRPPAAIGSVLLDQARQVDADLMVLGACIRHRLEQRLFGSVTRELLDAATIPMVMVHYAGRTIGKGSQES